MLYACGDKQSYSVINTKFSFPDRRFAHTGILSHSFSLGFELSEKLTAVHYIYEIKYIEAFYFVWRAHLPERWFAREGGEFVTVEFAVKKYCGGERSCGETGKGVVAGRLWMRKGLLFRRLIVNRRI